MPSPGERLLLPCEGGPCLSRLVRWPVPLEIEERDGTYVLVDDGPVAAWRYLFVPDRPWTTGRRAAVRRPARRPGAR